MDVSNGLCHAVGEGRDDQRPPQEPDDLDTAAAIPTPIEAPRALAARRPRRMRSGRGALRTGEEMKRG